MVNGGITQTQAANTPTVATSTTVAGAVGGRLAWTIQNQDTNPLKVLLGVGASATVYHFVLRASTGAADGTGGTVGQEAGAVYTGPISVYSAGTPSYTYLEMAP